MSVRFTGINELRVALRNKTNLNGARTTVRVNGAQMQQKAQRNAPVDTGNLKRSIGLELSDGGLTAKVTPTAEYAPYLEYGTRFMEARPFIGPAFDEQKEQFKRDMDKLVR